MNSKEMYLAINLIEDDLIEEALSIETSKKATSFRKYALLAASICIVMIASLVANNNSNVYVNELAGVTMQAKVDADYALKEVGNDELIEHFANFHIVDTLPWDLTLVNKKEKYQFIINDDNSVFDDTTKFLYKNDDKEVVLQLSKIGLNFGDVFASVVKAKPSEIKGEKVIIASYIDFIFDDDVIEIEKYVAEIKIHDVYVNVSAKGFAEEEFIELIESIIEEQLDK